MIQVARHWQIRLLVRLTETGTMATTNLSTIVTWTRIAHCGILLILPSLPDENRMPQQVENLRVDSGYFKGSGPGLDL
eukprot:3737958-Rhodomonas_salina.1